MTSVSPLDSSAPVPINAQSSVAAVPNTAVSVKNETDLTVLGSTQNETAGVYQPRDVFLTDVLLYRTTISSSDGSGPLGAYPAYVWTDYLTKPLISGRTTGFTYLHADLELTILLNCPGSSVGAYVVTFVPDGGAVATPFAYGSYSNTDSDLIWNSTQTPHVILNCESQASATVHLPFLWPQNAIDLTTAENPIYMWRMVVYALSPLNSTITTTPISGSIVVYCRMGGDYKLETRQYESGVAKAFSKSAAALSGVPAIGSFAKAASSGLAKVSSIMDMFGFTRESAPETPGEVVLRPFSNLAVVDGSDTSHPIALSSANTVTIDGSVVGTGSVDEMAFDYLFQHWTVVKTFNISTSDVVGTVMEIPVTPFLGQVDGLEINFNQWNFAVPGYVGLPFQYWSGAVEFRVYIPSSTNLQGRLQVFWNPITGTPMVPGVDPTVYLEGTMIDLAGSTDTTIRVNMSPPNPVRECFPYNVTDLAISANPSSCNGKLVFYLTQPLNSPLASFSLPVIIMMRGSPTLRFHQPRNMLINRPFGQAVSYALEGKDDSNVDDRLVEFSKGTTQNLSDVYFGEQVESVRALMQKFSVYTNIHLEQTGAPIFEGRPPIVLLPMPPIAPAPLGTDMIYAFPDQSTIQHASYNTSSMPVTNSISPMWTWQAHYSLMYAGVRGSTRVKLVPMAVEAAATTQSALFTGTASLSDMQQVNYLNSLASADPLFRWNHPLGVGVGGLLTHFDYTMVKTGEMSSEVTIPFYSPYKFVNARTMRYNPTGLNITSPTPFSAAGLFVSLAPLGSTNRVVECTVLVAGGSDYHGIRFRRVPKVVIASFFEV